MKLFPTANPTFRLYLAALILLPASFLAANFARPSAQTQSQAGTSARTQAIAQLRIAVASNSDAELQKVETALPDTEEAALARLLRGYLRLQAKDLTGAAALLSDQAPLKHTAVGDYALYFRGQALQEAKLSEQAEAEFRRLAQKFPDSLLARAAALQAAGSATLRGDHQTALNDLAPLVAANDGTALKLKADTLEKLGRTAEAITTLRKLHFDAPQSAEAGQVAARLTLLGSSTAPTDAALQRNRADKLYGAGLYVLAGQAYEQLARLFPAAATDETWLAAGRSYYKGNSFTLAVAALLNVRARTPKLMSETYYYLGACYVAQRSDAQAMQALNDLRRSSPDSPYIAALLYRLGSAYDKRGQQPQAAAFYDQLVRQFPQAEHADEAHFWLAWRAHLAKDYVNAAHLLTEHLADYGHTTDNRGRAAFWAAVDNERAGQPARALTIHRALLKRYGAGWFGVNSERRIALLQQTGVKPQQDSLLTRAAEGLQPITSTIETIKDADLAHVAKAEQLARIALHQSALNELEAARDNAPNSPLVNLRIAQIHRLRNDPAAAINVLKRSYPDYGQTLPEEMSREVWEVFYPLSYWPTIKEEARRRNLDPYLVAGVIRQETIFNPRAVSRANAVGMMQLLPSTGRMVARRYSLGGGNVSTADLFNPVLNIQLGTAFLEQLIGEFGRFEYVAAAYNGGPTRVARWRRELPAAEIEEWVESIPITETRLYVQGVYRNARQYQRLYDEQGRFKSSVPER